MTIETDNAQRDLLSGRKLNIWSHTYRIRSHEVTPGERLSIPAIFHFMQDGASSHAKTLGLSVDQLMQKGFTWVLSRLMLAILAPLPRWEECIKMQTWPSGNKGPFALRDFLFKNNEGRTVAVAVSGWLVIDISTRKPQRIETFNEMLHPIKGYHAISPNLDKIPPCQQSNDYQRQFAVRRRDLDVNEHVNNVSYMEWILETMPDAILSQKELKKISLNFIGEAKRNDHVLSVAEAVKTEQKSRKSVYLHRIVHQSDPHELLRAKSEWEQS
ncbi:MAG: thioesterase [Desulfobacteraceae bacterium]|jgi:acyl-ACP thioesterase